MNVTIASTFCKLKVPDFKSDRIMGANEKCELNENKACDLYSTCKEFPAKCENLNITVPRK